MLPVLWPPGGRIGETAMQPVTEATARAAAEYAALLGIDTPAAPEDTADPAALVEGLAVAVAGRHGACPALVVRGSATACCDGDAAPCSRETTRARAAECWKNFLLTMEV